MQLEFELAYDDVTVLHVTHHATGIRKCMEEENEDFKDSEKDYYVTAWGWDELFALFPDSSGSSRDFEGSASNKCYLLRNTGFSFNWNYFS